MLVEYDHFRGLPVASMVDEAQIGRVDDVVLHPDTGELVGFWVKTGGWLAPKRALSSRDIVSYDHQALVVRTADALVEPGEIRPFHAVASRNDHWMGKAVETESGQALGKVRNLVINTDLEMLAKLYVKGTLGAERVIGREEITNVTPKVITVKDTRVPQTVVTASEAAPA